MDDMSRPMIRYANVSTREESPRIGSGVSNDRESETVPIIRRDSEGGLGPFPSLSEMNESQSVRLNVATTVATPERRSQSVLVYVQTLLQLPPALAALIVVPLSWHKGEHCSQPLSFWAVVYAFILLTSLFSAWMSYLEPTEIIEEMSRLRRVAESVKKPLESLTLGWLIIGQVWVQSAESCVGTSPSLFTLSFWLVFIGFTYFLLPCIIIILALPFICFCLPCVIRLLARFAGAEQFRSKGVPEQVINSITSKKYHAGLFQDEIDPQCSICLSSYEEEQDLRILPCDGRHHFHKECVDEWLRVNGSCPICRASVVSQQESEQETERERNAAVNADTVDVDVV